MRDEKQVSRHYRVAMAAQKSGFSFNFTAKSSQWKIFFVKLFFHLSPIAIVKVDSTFYLATPELLYNLRKLEVLAFHHEATAFSLTKTVKTPFQLFFFVKSEIRNFMNISTWDRFCNLSCQLE